jgi:hypothetical protein
MTAARSVTRPILADHGEVAAPGAGAGEVEDAARARAVDEIPERALDGRRVRPLPAQLLRLLQHSPI